jgi:TPR repeat protein
MQSEITSKELFVDFQTGRKRQVKKLVRILKAGHANSPDYRLEDYLNADPHSYAVLAYAFHFGFYRTEADHQRAIELLKKGLAKNQNSAFFVMGVIQLKLGFKTEGNRLIRQAAEMGYAPAQFAWGRAHYKRDGTGADHEYGKAYLLKASSNGYLAARYVLFAERYRPSDFTGRLALLRKTSGWILTFTEHKIREKLTPFSKRIHVIRKV